jgi:hypothetical protein
MTPLRVFTGAVMRAPMIVETTMNAPPRHVARDSDGETMTAQNGTVELVRKDLLSGELRGKERVHLLADDKILNVAIQLAEFHVGVFE